MPHDVVKRDPALWEGCGGPAPRPACAITAPARCSGPPAATRSAAGGTRAAARPATASRAGRRRGGARAAASATASGATCPARRGGASASTSAAYQRVKRRGYLRGEQWVRQPADAAVAARALPVREGTGGAPCAQHISSHGTISRVSCTSAWHDGQRLSIRAVLVLLVVVRDEVAARRSTGTPAASGAREPRKEPSALSMYLQREPVMSTVPPTVAHRAGFTRGRRARKRLVAQVAQPFSGGGEARERGGQSADDERHPICACTTGTGWR